ncbi:allantoinase, mitochondrial-like [Watersipora subatra]|uniref:allantoinase, mitochondrial-like n=1 Tax=Watersipora subatra TaxID=2589382 RepID=UPI00355C4A58
MIIQGHKVLYNNELQPAQVHIADDGDIAGVTLGYDKDLRLQTDELVIDAGHRIVMPGIVDAHVHVNEPGRTDWEGFETATKAAAAGGITTIIDMPLNCDPVTTSVKALEKKIPHAQAENRVNIAFWGGIVPGNQSEIKPMINKGVRGFKAFLIHSGIDEFPHCAEADLRAAYQELRGTKSVFLFHAEVDCGNTAPSDSESKHYKTFLDMRPEIMEVEAIKLVIKLCKEYQVRSHIVHLSAASALPIIRQAQKEGVPLTVETCHHYLTLASEDVPDGQTEYKCCPPIRSKKNQEALWEALKDETISMVVSDHSPCTSDLKMKEKGDFMKAWGGVAGLQLGLPLFWTSCRKRGIPVDKLAEYMSANTAKHAGLMRKVGNNAPGLRGDFVIFDPDQSFTVTKEMLHHKNKLSPYLGMTLYGVVETTIVGGAVAYHRETGFPGDNCGKVFLTFPAM